MQSHSDLDESLQEFLFGTCRSAPDVLPGFVSLKEVGAIEIVHGALVKVQVHRITKSPAKHALDYLPRMG